MVTKEEFKKAVWDCGSDKSPSPDVNVIGDLVNEVQSAFVAEQQILDGPLILNETRVIKAIHGDDGKLDNDVIVGGQICWTSIVKEARSLKGTGINVVDLIRLKLRNGDSSSF
nr:RNA-directed DNA polymerase, eukaryota, reverse transcriptase zinc-binding domain protein [Tanacetum cinerariifolium]